MFVSNLLHTCADMTVQYLGAIMGLDSVLVLLQGYVKPTKSGWFCKFYFRSQTIMGQREVSLGLKPKATGGRTVSSGGLKPKRTGAVSKYPTPEPAHRTLKPKPTNDLKPKRTAETSRKYRVPVEDVSIDLKPKRTAGSSTRTTPKHSGADKGAGSAKKVSYTTSTPTAVENQFNVCDMSAIGQQRNRYHLTPGEDTSYY